MLYLDTLLNLPSETLDTLAYGTLFRAADVYVYPGLNGLYNACLPQPNSTRSSAMDLWSNIKIPDLARSRSADASSDGWVSFDDPDGIVYSSLLGIPLLRVPSEETPPSTLRPHTSPSRASTPLSLPIKPASYPRLRQHLRLRLAARGLTVHSAETLHGLYASMASITQRRSASTGESPNWAMALHSPSPRGP